MKQLVEEFIERASAEKGFNVSIQELELNNGFAVYGFKFDEETEVPIVFNIDKAMEKFVNREIELEDAYHEVAQIIENANIANKKIKNIRLNKEYILNNVFFETINFSENITRLDELPFTKILDLANIFRVKLDVSVDSMNKGEPLSFLVDNNLLNKYFITLEELNLHAKMNMFKWQTPIFFPLFLSFELEKWDEYDHDYSTDVTNELYCLTYRDSRYGSTLINSGEKLEEIANRLNSDLIIIPSSTEELLVFRKFENWKKLALGLMEQKQHISEELFLSNNLYEYKRGEKALHIVSDYLY